MTTVVHGIPQAIAAFERRKIQAKIAEPIAATAGGNVVALVARAKAPRRTGALAGSVTVDVEGDTAHVGAVVRYARFVEKGTVHMEAQPFLQEAASQSEHAVEAAMAAIFKLAMR